MGKCKFTFVIETNSTVCAVSSCSHLARNFAVNLKLSFTGLARLLKKIFLRIYWTTISNREFDNFNKSEYTGVRQSFGTLATHVILLSLAPAGNTPR